MTTKRLEQNLMLLFNFLLIPAADFLGTKGWMDVTPQSVAGQSKAKSPEELRAHVTCAFRTNAHAVLVLVLVLVVLVLVLGPVLVLVLVLVLCTGGARMGSSPEQGSSHGQLTFVLIRCPRRWHAITSPRRMAAVAAGWRHSRASS